MRGSARTAPGLGGTAAPRRRGIAASRRGGIAGPRLGVIAAAAAAALLVGGCADHEASGGGGSFQFKSPNGQTFQEYPKGERGLVEGLAGETLDPDQPEAGGRERIGVDDFPDTVMVLNIWGSWCGPCRGESDDLITVANDTRSAGVQFLGIDVRDSKNAAIDFSRDRDVPYPSIYDFEQRSLLTLKGIPTQVVPATLVLDREHRVAAVYMRTVTADELAAKVNQIVAE